MTFKEHLDEKIKDAEAEYQEAKEKAIRDLEYMNTRMAVQYGSVYYSKADRLGVIAAKLETLAEMKIAYEYMEEHKEDN